MGWGWGVCERVIIHTYIYSVRERVVLLSFSLDISALDEGKVSPSFDPTACRAAVKRGTCEKVVSVHVSLLDHHHQSEVCVTA